MLSQNALYYYSCCIRIRTLTYLIPPETGPDLAPFSALGGSGCQGFTGPIPSAFLDKDV